MTDRTESSFINVKPDKDRLINLISEIENGSIKIPVFQRDFVWKSSQMLQLFDSILKGYPIGSLLFWKPNEEFQTKRFIGPYLIEKSSREVRYVLDGFQRLSTLFGALTNPIKFGFDERLGGAKEFNIFYNLSDKEFTYIKNSKEKRYYYIPVYKIVDTFEFLDFVKDLETSINDKSESKRLIENAKEISKTFYDYEIPFVSIRGGDIKSAVEIFSRINSTGTEISQDFMLSALSYNSETGFLFSDAITEFLERLSAYNFENLKRDTVLNCISNTRNKVYFDVKVEDLIKLDLEGVSTEAFGYIERAVRFLCDYLFVLDVRMLPYPTQLIFISDFFRLNQECSYDELRKLTKWFWITSYSNYFTIYSLSQQREAYKKFVSFASGDHDDGILRIIENFDVAEFPEKLNFTGVRTKTLQLFMINYAYEQSQLDYGQQLREIFIFNKKDRRPGNMILLSSSDYLSFAADGRFDFFASSSDEVFLKRFFLNERLLDLYKSNQTERFIFAREAIIKSEEHRFITSFGMFNLFESESHSDQIFLE